MEKKYNTIAAHQLTSTSWQSHHLDSWGMLPMHSSMHSKERNTTGKVECFGGSKAAVNAMRCGQSQKIGGESDEFHAPLDSLLVPTQNLKTKLPRQEKLTFLKAVKWLKTGPCFTALTSSNVCITLTRVCSAAPLSHPASSQISFRGGIDLSSGTWLRWGWDTPTLLLFPPSLPFSLLTHRNQKQHLIFHSEPAEAAVFDPNHQNCSLGSYKQYDMRQNQTNDIISGSHLFLL